MIERYKFTWLDFDIENKGASNVAANQRRNTVLAKLQTKMAGLRVSYTLPVDPNGIPKIAQKMLADARAKGVKVHSANIMTMDFGEHHSKGKKLSEVCIASAIKAREQVQQIDPAIQIGLTPMIGVNDVKTEVFTIEEAKALLSWAEKHPWICSIGFWSVNRDNGDSATKDKANTRSGIDQQAFDFTKAFKEFTSK